MKLNAYRRLNQIQLGMGIGSLILIGTCLLFFRKNRTVLSLTVLCIFVEVLIFPYLEQRLPQKEIQNAVGKGKIALLNLISVTEEKTVRDASFHTISLMRVTGILYLNNHCTRKFSFVDRFASGYENCHDGSVYVVFDEKQPEVMSLIPTELLMHYPELQPIVAAYENDPKIRIVYRNVVYSHGFRIEPMEKMMRKVG